MRKKKSHLDIKSINTISMFWTALTHKITFVATWRLFISGMTEFFIPQFTTMFRLSDRPVVSVDHPLDETIPFRPELVNIYMHFYPLCIKCMYFLYKEFGKPALPVIRDIMNDVANIYYEAGKIYRERQSTTDRPRYLKTAKFRLIHLVDPHLHCVPSLHVLLVVFNYVRMSQIIDRFSAEDSDYSEQLAYMYSQAVEITNSILFIKQHSVNCIPAALYTMSNLYPEYTMQRATSFIDDLVIDQSLDSRDQIKEFIHTQYRGFMESDSDTCYRDVLLDFLRTCEPVAR
jgi:hypothetical protein